jgi:hypothetical protein
MTIVAYPGVALLDLIATKKGEWTTTTSTLHPPPHRPGRALRRR